MLGHKNKSGNLTIPKTEPGGIVEAPPGALSGLKTKPYKEAFEEAKKEVIETGRSIMEEQEASPSISDLRDDIIEAAVDHVMGGGSSPELKLAVDAYHKALRLENMEGRRKRQR